MSPGSSPSQAARMTRRITFPERVVGSTLDVPVAGVVDQRPVAVDPDAREARPVGLDVAIRVTPEATRHARQRLADDELADDATDRHAVRADDVRGDADVRTTEGARPDGRQQVAGDDPAGHLGPAAVVDDWTAAPADLAEEPPPRVRVPRLAGRAEHAQRRHVVALHGLAPVAHEPPADRRRQAEVRD